MLATSAGSRAWKTVLIVSPSLVLALARHAGARPGHGPQPRHGNGTAAHLASAEAARLEPPQSRPDCVELVMLPAFQAREQILRGSATRALDESTSTLGGQRGELVIRRHHRSQQAGPSVAEALAQLFRPLRSRALPLRSRAHGSLRVVR